jgi:uncharacterized protein YdhG (YjbR/CyaY superfamily)
MLSLLNVFLIQHIQDTMQAEKIKFQTVGEYISTFPADVRETLEKIRETIKQAAPGAEEVISYQMPAFRFNGAMMIYFAAFKKHYSIFIPHPSKIYDAFKDEFSPYEIHKSTIKFPSDKPFPLHMLSKMIKFMVEENRGSGKTKK